MEQRGLSGLGEQLGTLDNHGHPQQVLDAVVDLECFRGWLVGRWAPLTQHMPNRN
jgi:hypothetical protein